MKHVHSEGVKTCDIDAPGEGPHYAVGPLFLILIRGDKGRRGALSMLRCKPIVNIREIQTACQLIAIPDSCRSCINLRAPHLFIELDLVFQDDPVGSIRLLPRQRQTVPGDING